MAIPKQNFTPKDLYNLSMISHIYWDNMLATDKLKAIPADIPLKDKISLESEQCKTLRDLTKYLSLFSETSAASRLWQKEI